LSDVSELLSGVIQGSSIGPLMFLIFINELIHVLEKLGIKVKLFADDAKLYLRVTDANDIIKLQAALDALSNWAATWQLTVSVEKCFVLNIGNVIIQPRISINGWVNMRAYNFFVCGPNFTKFFSSHVGMSAGDNAVFRLSIYLSLPEVFATEV